MGYLAIILILVWYSLHATSHLLASVHEQAMQVHTLVISTDGMLTNLQ